MNTQVFQSLRLALKETYGFEPTVSRLAMMLGENTSITHYWLNVLPHRHVIAFLELIERLPEARRKSFINECCRELPLIDHARFGCDPLAAGQMESLLRLSNGVTWVQGGSEFLRTFFVTALGHSFPRVCGARAMVAGIDVHEPRRWVPIETVTYFKELLSPARVKAMISEHWPEVRAAKAQLILLNGVWTAADPNLRLEIQKIALSRHVLMSVPAIPDVKLLMGDVDAPTRIVTINCSHGQEWMIRFRVETV